MKSLSKFIALFIVAIFALASSCSNNDDTIAKNPIPSNITTEEDLSVYLENLVHTNEVPGFSITVASNNTVAFQQSFGFADLESQIPYTNETVNGIASISKTFVAAATAKAMEQGYFSLDTNINDVLPIEVNNPKQPSTPIKIKHLVTHTSGIVDNPATYISNDYYILSGENINTTASNIMMNSLGIDQGEQVDLDDYLSEIFDEDGALYSLDNYLDAVPGEQWMYSNTATSLMGYIIEYVSEQSFDEYVKEYILNPLQMTDSTLDIYETDISSIATQYLNVNAPFPRYNNHGYPEGSMLTTNDDLTKYLLDMMRGRRGEASILFSQEYYDLLFEEQLQDGIVPIGFAENHGLYWYMKDGNIIHGGNSLGVSSHMQFMDDGSSGFFIVSNMDGTFYENEGKWEIVKSLISDAIQQYVNNNQ